MRFFKLIIPLLFVGFVIFVIIMAIASQKKEIPTVALSYRDISEKLSVSGRIEPKKEIDVKSPISGVLETLYVEVGNEVKEGDPIARVQFVKDPLEKKNLLKQLEIEKSQFQQQKSHFERVELLYNKGLVSNEDYEQELSLYNVAKSELEAVSTEVEMIEGQYRQEGISNIVWATGNGTVLQLPIKEGGSVMARGTLSEGTTIVKIADLGSLLFKGYVLESDIVKVKKGQMVKVSVATNKSISLDGEVLLIAPKAEIINDAIKFELSVMIHVPDSLRQFLFAGSSASAEIICRERLNVLSVDEKYLKFRGDSVYLETVVNKNKVEDRLIETGVSDGVYIEIVSGIDSTTRIRE